MYEVIMYNKYDLRMQIYVDKDMVIRYRFRYRYDYIDIGIDLGIDIDSDIHVGIQIFIPSIWFMMKGLFSIPLEIKN